MKGPRFFRLRRFSHSERGILLIEVIAVMVVIILIFGGMFSFVMVMERQLRMSAKHEVEAAHWTRMAVELRDDLRRAAGAALLPGDGKGVVARLEIAHPDGESLCIYSFGAAGVCRSVRKGAETLEELRVPMEALRVEFEALPAVAPARMWETPSAAAGETPVFLLCRVTLRFSGGRERTETIGAARRVEAVVMVKEGPKP